MTSIYIIILEQAVFASLYFSVFHVPSYAYQTVTFFILMWVAIDLPCRSLCLARKRRSLLPALALAPTWLLMWFGLTILYMADGLTGQVLDVLYR